MSQGPPPVAIRAYWPEVYDFAFRASRVIRRVPFPLTISSWWRDARESRALGSSSTSQHRVGLALDLQPRERAAWPWRGARFAPAWEAIIAAARAEGLVPVDERNKPNAPHIHVQYGPAGYVDRGLKAGKLIPV